MLEVAQPVVVPKEAKIVFHVWSLFQNAVLKSRSETTLKPAPVARKVFPAEPVTVSNPVAVDSPVRSHSKIYPDAKVRSPVKDWWPTAPTAPAEYLPPLWIVVAPASEPVPASFAPLAMVTAPVPLCVPLMTKVPPFTVVTPE